jgi:hypothetical protein
MDEPQFRVLAAGHCAACGGSNRGDDPLLPFSLEPIGYGWLHSRCWPAWHAGRKAEAVTALAALGIAPLVKPPNDFGKNVGE